MDEDEQIGEPELDIEAQKIGRELIEIARAQLKAKLARQARRAAREQARQVEPENTRSEPL